MIIRLYFAFLDLEKVCDRVDRDAMWNVLRLCGVPVWETRNAVHSHSHSFSVVRCSTAQYSRCFIPASTKCWNDLPSGVVDCLELQKFKVGAKFLLDR